MKNNSNGSAFIMTMFVSGILLFAAGVMAVVTNQMVFSAQRNHRSAQALDSAEAGVADMMSKLSTNYIYWSNNRCSAVIGGISYETTTITLPNGNVQIISTGKCSGITRWTVVELLGTSIDKNNNLWSGDSAMLSGGNTLFTTAAFTINGNVHANGNIDSSNGAKNGTISGAITANGNIGDVSSSNTNRTPSSPVKELPVFNFESYRSLAISGGSYYGSAISFNGANLTPANGILYVNGNCLFSNKSSVKGTIIVNGDLTIGNQFTHIAFTTNMPSILVKGNLFIQNKTTFSGLVYSTGDIQVQNNSDFNGGIMAVGNITVQNNCTVNKNATLPSWDPLNPMVPPKVIIGAWVK